MDKAFQRQINRQFKVLTDTANYQAEVKGQMDWVQPTCRWILEIVSRPEDSMGFV